MNAERIATVAFVIVALMVGCIIMYFGLTGK